MDSNNYESLLPGNGTNSPVANAVWNDMSFDDNDAVDTDNPTYVSKNSYCVYILPVILLQYRRVGIIDVLCGNIKEYYYSYTIIHSR